MNNENYQQWMEQWGIHTLSNKERRAWIHQCEWARSTAIPCDKVVLSGIENELMWYEHYALDDLKKGFPLKLSEVVVEDKYAFLSAMASYQWIMIDSLEGLPDIYTLLNTQNIQRYLSFPADALGEEHDAFMAKEQCYWNVPLLLSQDYIFHKVFHQHKRVFIQPDMIVASVEDGRYCTEHNKEWWLPALKDRALAGYPEALSLWVQKDSASAKETLKDRWLNVVEHHHELKESEAYAHIDVLTHSQLALLCAQQKYKRHTMVGVANATDPQKKEYIQKIAVLEMLDLLPVVQATDNFRSYTQKFMSALKRHKNATIVHEETLYL